MERLMRYMLSGSSTVEVFDLDLLVDVLMPPDAQFLISLLPNSAVVRSKLAAVVPLVVSHLPFSPPPISVVRLSLLLVFVLSSSSPPYRFQLEFPP